MGMLRSQNQAAPGCFLTGSLPPVRPQACVIAIECGRCHLQDAGEGLAQSLAGPGCVVSDSGHGQGAWAPPVSLSCFGAKMLAHWHSVLSKGNVVQATGRVRSRPAISSPGTSHPRLPCAACRRCSGLLPFSAGHSVSDDETWIGHRGPDCSPKSLESS